jgi:hypothetical protein
MILRTHHISVIATFLVFTNARIVQSATQNEVVKQPESPDILGTIHNYTYNHYSQNPNPSFHQRPNNQMFPFFQPMQINTYSQYPLKHKVVWTTLRTEFLGPLLWERLKRASHSKEEEATGGQK